MNSGVWAILIAAYIGLTVRYIILGDWATVFLACILTCGSIYGVYNGN